MKHFIASRIINLSIVSMVLFTAAIAFAQQPTRHKLIRSDMPPGLAADYSRLINPSLRGHVQPVRLISPSGTKIEIAESDKFKKTGASQVSVGLMVGPVYRFRLTDIPQNKGKELFPSIEVLNRLCPPEGLENEFPIQVVITLEDLNRALAGILVTRVIYLEDPETTVPQLHRMNSQPSIDVSGGRDAFRAADQLGRPMAILRIGSRIPMPTDLVSEFNFNAPPAVVLPDPKTPSPASKTDASRSAINQARQASYSSPTGMDYDKLNAIDACDQTGALSGIPCPAPHAGCEACQIGLPTGPTIIQGCRPHRDEFVFDGNDRGEKVRVDPDFRVHGLQTEDTVAHFDTLDGQRIVIPSNRVGIYAPRFGAVRKFDGVFNARLRQPVVALEEQTPIALAAGNDESSTTKQHVALKRFEGANRASGFIDRTRGVVTGTAVQLFGSRSAFRPFENLSMMRLGKYSNAESARLNFGIQSALVWEDDLGLQVVVKKALPIIVRDTKTIHETVRYESKDNAVLRVTKIASKIAAKTGEIVEFTIRFDNLGDKPVGNVTIIDNLTHRLQYVPDSAQSTLDAKFINAKNDSGSLMLRWEITEPVEAHTGGLVRFKCRVQ